MRLQDAPQERPRSWFDWADATRLFAERSFDWADGARLFAERSGPGDGYDSGRNLPLKQLPAEGRHYFQPHIERLLFPLPSSDVTRPFAARWLKQPLGEELILAARTPIKNHTYRLRVDLLERYVPPLRPRKDFGLVHLALLDEASAEDLLRCSDWLRRMFRAKAGAGPHLASNTREPAWFAGNWPIAEWLEHLFGASQEGVERMYYVAALVPKPADVKALWERQNEEVKDGYEPGDAWLRALTRGGQKLLDARRASEQDEVRGRRPGVHLGPFSGYVLGRGCGLACEPRAFGGDSVRNLRSYWAEALMLGLVQQTYLEDHAQRLGALGADPSLPDLDELYEDWLAFRNVLWWSQPSDRDAPGALLGALRADLGGGELFDELAGDFGAYVAHRQRRLASRQDQALTELQAYGAAGTLVAAIAAALAFIGLGGGDPWWVKTLVIFVLGAVFVGTVVTVRKRTAEESRTEG